MQSFSSAADSTHALEAEVTDLRQRLCALESTQAENERVMQTLLETSETYRILLDESSDPIFAFLRDSTYRYVNRAFADGVSKVLPIIIGMKI